LRDFWSEHGVDDPEIPILLRPLPEIETMHEMTGYDS